MRSASRGFLQRRAEGRHQLVRQVANESHRVGEDDGPPSGNIQSPHRRIERREQLILDVDARVRQRVEQASTCRRSCIRPGPPSGCPHGSRFWAIHRAPLRPTCSSRCLELADTVADQASIALELGLTRTAKADTALLPFEVSPAPDQSGRQVPQLRELDLQLAFETPRALREDVQDQTGTIQAPDI